MCYAEIIAFLGSSVHFRWYPQENPFYFTIKILELFKHNLLNPISVGAVRGNRMPHFFNFIIFTSKNVSSCLDFSLLVISHFNGGNVSHAGHRKSILKS